MENFSKLQAITAQIINQEGAAGKKLATIRLKSSGASLPALEALFNNVSKTKLLQRLYQLLLTRLFVIIGSLEKQGIQYL